MRFGDARGAYEIETLPGSPQVAVSLHSFVFPEERGKGHGSRLHQERLKKVEDLGFDYIMCTVRADNEYEIKILDKHGWRLLDDFWSSATGNRVFIYGKLIERGV